MPSRPYDTESERTERLNYQFPADTEPTPAEEGVIKFKAMYARMSTSKSGDLVLVLLIPKSDKLNAVMVSDYPSKVLDVEVRTGVTGYSDDVQKALQDMGIGLATADEL